MELFIREKTSPPKASDDFKKIIKVGQLFRYPTLSSIIVPSTILIILLHCFAIPISWATII